MSNNGIVEWLHKHDRIFGQLQDGVTETAKAAGRAGRDADEDPSSPATTDALAAVRDNAQQLLATARSAQQLPPIPDQATATAFSAGVARWIDASETLVEAAERRDLPEVHRAARALDAGTDEFLRAAAALRRATGQQPDPRNPRN